MTDRSPRSEVGILQERLRAYADQVPVVLSVHNLQQTLREAADELDGYDHLRSEWSYESARGDHLVYESEWEAFTGPGGNGMTATPCQCKRFDPEPKA